VINLCARKKGSTTRKKNGVKPRKTSGGYRALFSIGILRSITNSVINRFFFGWKSVQEFRSPQPSWFL